MNKLIYTLAFLLVATFQTFAQQDSTQNISIIAKAGKDKIILRWGGHSPRVWRYANQYGYNLYRTTIISNGNAVQNRTQLKLNNSPLKPYPAKEWEKVIDNNDYAAIMAQSIFGESFEITGTSNDVVSLINKSKEEEQRFSFALFAADQDFEVAKMAGLAWVDENVKAGERYLYQITLNIPDSIFSTDTAAVFLGLMDYRELPEVNTLVAVFNDGIVQLNWDNQLLSQTYSGYNIERSEDRQNFISITERPIVDLNPDISKPGQGISFFDTIANNTTYYYRIQGVSYFGESGPWSKVVSGNGHKALEYNPHFTGFEFLNPFSVKLQWEYNQEGIELTDHFEINCSETDAGSYKTVKSGIDANKTETIIDSLWYPSNYLVITAVGKNGEQKMSTPYLVQVVDSFPPAPPVNLSGKMDSTGIVTILWDTNTEPDIFGYKILRGNSPKEEFSVLNSSPVLTNSFNDTLPVEFLNEKIYYNIVAIDKRNNHSEHSKMLVVERPDLIPPSAPVFTVFKTKPDSVLLSWINSSSSDVEVHELYRREIIGNIPGEWNMIFTTDSLAIDSFIDTNVKGKTKYEFAIVALDDAGLRSEKENKIVITTPSGVDMEILSDFKVVADYDKKGVMLNWNSQPETIKTIWLYKAEADNPLTLYKTFSNDTSSFFDQRITLDSNYKYLLKAISVTGQPSGAFEKTIRY